MWSRYRFPSLAALHTHLARHTAPLPHPHPHPHPPAAPAGTTAATHTHPPESPFSPTPSPSPAPDTPSLAHTHAPHVLPTSPLCYDSSTIVCSSLASFTASLVTSTNTSTHTSTSTCLARVAHVFQRFAQHYFVITRHRHTRTDATTTTSAVDTARTKQSKFGKKRECDAHDARHACMYAYDAWRLPV